MRWKILFKCFLSSHEDFVNFRKNLWGFFAGKTERAGQYLLQSEIGNCAL